jgi:hypothetical protein
MEKIKLTKLTLSQEELNKLDPKQKKRFLMLTCFLRDLSLLQKCLLYTNNSKSTDEIQESATTTISFFFLKTLISKIHEMWFFLNCNKVLDDYPQFSDTLKEKIKPIQDFFSEENNILAFIRNKFGFHYEYWSDIDKEIDTSFQRIQTYEAWLSLENSANEIFSSSNAIILDVIFSKMKNLGFEGDEKQLMDELFKLTLQFANLFRDFTIYYLTEVFPIKWEQEKESETEAHKLSEILLPLIVAK